MNLELVWNTIGITNNKHYNVYSNNMLINVKPKGDNHNAYMLNNIEPFIDIPVDITDTQKSLILKYTSLSSYDRFKLYSHIKQNLVNKCNIDHSRISVDNINTSSHRIYITIYKRKSEHEKKTLEIMEEIIGLITDYSIMVYDNNKRILIKINGIEAIPETRKSLTTIKIDNSAFKNI